MCRGRAWMWLVCLLTALAALGGEEVSVMRTRGIRYLLACQEGAGSWMGAVGHPAMTALAVMGIYGTPDYKASEEIRGRMDKALDYIVSNAQEDGGIYRPRGEGQGAAAGGYAVYNTSICLLALATCNRPGDVAVMRKARAYLMGSDAIPDASGGFGYGSKTRADLNNTAWALDAIQATDHLDREPFTSDPAAAKRVDLAWENALTFVTMCQNLKATNQSAWVASAPESDAGGFIYCPQEALQEKAPARALRSYGSMTYSGLKSLIYAKVKPDDARMVSALDWVRRNYTLDSNPGVGQAGLFYYFHTFAKTLALLKQDTLTDAKGVSHAWKAELAARLAALQRKDGSWCNERSGRWMESIPQLATAYSLMAIQYLK